MANEVKVEITVEEKQALQALAKLTRNVDNTTTKATKSFGKMDGAISSFAGNLAAMAASKAFSLLASGITGAVEASKSLETISTQFQTILGSASAAQRQLEDLQEFAATTPFQIEGLSLATRQLLSFGVAQAEIIPTLRQLGDLAAGTGSSIDELTIPFGRLVSTQKLTLIELDKFADRGINLFGALAEKTGISLKNIRDAVSKGKIPFEAFTDSLNELTNKGGIFFGATEAQSKTLSGVLSTLDDNFFNLQGAIGDAFKPVLIAGATELTGIMQDMTKAFKEDGPALVKTIGALADFFVITPSKFWVNVFGGDGPSKNVSNLTGEITKLEKQLKLVEADFKVQKESAFSRFIGADDESLQKMGDLMAKITELKKARAELKAQQEKPKEEIIDDAVVKDKDEDIGPDKLELERIRLTQAEIQAIKEENLLIDQERALRVKEARGVATEEELLELQDIELEKINIKANAEFEKTKAIEDATKRRLAQQKLNAKTEAQIEQSVTKAKVSEAARQVAINKQKTSDMKSTLSTISTLQSSGSKELFFIGKAAAVAQHAMAVPAAISKALNAAPPPFNFVLAGLVGAAMGIQGAKLAAAKPPAFAGGGVVGGFAGSVGAIGGNDNRTITAKDGEMFLNAPQQRNVFEAINSGNLGGGGDSNEAIQALLSQPIIIEIDNKEIARAVRDARKDGFAA